MASSGSVLVLHGGLGEAQRYRCLHLQEQLGSVGIPCEVRLFRHKAVALPTCQLLILHRVPWDGWTQQLIAHQRAAGTRLIFETDDLIFDAAVFPALADMAMKRWARAQLYQDEMRRYRRLLLASDAALVSTSFLAEQVQALHKPAYVYRNAFSFEMLACAQKVKHIPQTKIVLGYASGTPTHDKDFAVITPVLQNLLDAFPQVELHLIGPLNLDPSWQRYELRVKRMPFVPWRELPAHLVKFDINLAPLEITNPFCQAKSEIKYIEAALVRVPTVASATHTFAQIMRQGETGFVATTLVDWAQVLRALIENETLRHTLGAQAYAHVLQAYHPRVRAQELLNLLPLLAPAWRAPVPHAVSSVPPEDPVPTLSERIYYAARYRGVKAFLLQALAFVQKYLP